MLTKKQKNIQITNLRLLFFLLIFGMLGVQTQLLAQETEHEEIPSEEVISNEVRFENLYKVPVYPGCEDLGNNEETKACMQAKVRMFMAENFNSKQFAKDSLMTGVQRINVRFRVDEKGKVELMHSRANFRELEDEAVRVINLLPDMVEPGQQRNGPVKVIYDLPIVLQFE